MDTEKTLTAISGFLKKALGPAVGVDPKPQSQSIRIIQGQAHASVWIRGGSITVNGDVARKPAFNFGRPRTGKINLEGIAKRAREVLDREKEAMRQRDERARIIKENVMRERKLVEAARPTLERLGWGPRWAWAEPNSSLEWRKFGCETFLRVNHLGWAARIERTVILPEQFEQFMADVREAKEAIDAIEATS